MPAVSELYNRHPGSDIYIVGTGASMRVFPVAFLEGKITIALNQAWKIAPATYAITIRPELNVPEFMGVAGFEKLVWVTKHEKLTSDEQRAYVAAHPDRFYFYRTDGKQNAAGPGQPSDCGRIPEWAERPCGDFLYLWSSISQSGVNLAANMGARNIFVVGCDNCALGGNHHAHQQHTFWKGEDPNVRYRQYEDGLSEVRAGLRKRGVNLFNLTPFVSLRDPDADFLRLCRETGQPVFIDNEDISHRQQPGGGRPSLIGTMKARVGRFTRRLLRRPN